MSQQLLQSHEDRLHRVEGQMRELQNQLNNMQIELHKNTLVTSQTNAELSDLVGLMKGGKSAGRILKWFSVVSVGAGAVYLAAKEVIHTMVK